MALARGGADGDDESAELELRGPGTMFDLTALDIAADAPSAAPPDDAQGSPHSPSARTDITGSASSSAIAIPAAVKARNRQRSLIPVRKLSLEGDAPGGALPPAAAATAAAPPAVAAAAAAFGSEGRNGLGPTTPEPRAVERLGGSAGRRRAFSLAGPGRSAEPRAPALSASPATAQHRRLSSHLSTSPIVPSPRGGKGPRGVLRLVRPEDRRLSGDGHRMPFAAALLETNEDEAAADAAGDEHADHATDPEDAHGGPTANVPPVATAAVPAAAPAGDAMDHGAPRPLLLRLRSEQTQQDVALHLLRTQLRFQNAELDAATNKAFTSPQAMRHAEELLDAQAGAIGELKERIRAQAELRVALAEELERLRRDGLEDTRLTEQLLRDGRPGQGTLARSGSMPGMRALNPSRPLRRALPSAREETPRAGAAVVIDRETPAAPTPAEANCALAVESADRCVHERMRMTNRRHRA